MSDNDENVRSESGAGSLSAEPQRMTLSERDEGSSSPASRASLKLGIASLVIYFAPLVLKALTQGLLSALDLGYLPPLSGLGVLTGLLGLVLGLFGVAREKERAVAVKGIVCNAIVVFFPVILLLLVALLSAGRTR